MSGKECIRQRIERRAERREQSEYSCVERNNLESRHHVIASRIVPQSPYSDSIQKRQHKDGHEGARISAPVIPCIRWRNGRAFNYAQQHRCMHHHRIRGSR
jgi:hypothetical protein